MPRTFRIMPLLIMVAMLAFSVRLVEVVAGFSTITGAAQAEEEEHDKAEAEHAPPPAAEPAAHPEEHADKENAEQAPKQDDLVIENDVKKSEESAKTEEEAAKVKTAPDVQAPAWQDATEANYTGVQIELFEDLAKRRKELDSREKELQTREALLRATQKELQQKYDELSTLRQEIEKLLEEQSDEEKARVVSLVRIYEGMKPKDAARIFDTLDLDILVSVMSVMSERKLSPILAAMNAERARTVTIMLAEQKKLPELPPAN